MGSASPRDSAHIPQIVNRQTHSPMRLPKAIIFDFDGVLVDTEEAIFFWKKSPGSASTGTKKMTNAVAWNESCSLPHLSCPVHKNS